MNDSQDTKKSIKHYRYDLSQYDNFYLQEFLKTCEDKNILKMFENCTEIAFSAKKHSTATKSANEAKIATAKRKIQDAINLLKLENEKINYSSIAKKAQVSRITVKKYVNLDDLA